MRGCVVTQSQERNQGVPRLGPFPNQKFLNCPCEATGQAFWQGGAFVPVGLGREMLTSELESDLIITSKL